MQKQLTASFASSFDIPSRHLRGVELSVRRLGSANVFVLAERFVRDTGTQRVRLEAGVVLVPDWRLACQHPAYKIYSSLHAALRGVGNALSDATASWRRASVRTGRHLLLFPTTPPVRREQAWSHGRKQAVDAAGIVASLSAWHIALQLEFEEALLQLQLAHDALVGQRSGKVTEGLCLEIIGHATAGFFCRPYRDLAEEFDAGLELSKLKQAVGDLLVCGRLETVNILLSRAYSFLRRRPVLESRELAQEVVEEAYDTVEKIRRAENISVVVFKIGQVRDSLRCRGENNEVIGKLQEARAVLKPFLAG